MIKAILQQYIKTKSLRSTIKFFSLNYCCKHIKRDKDVFLFLYPRVHISFGKGSIVELHGCMTLGVPSISGSKRHSYLQMSDNSMICVNQRCTIMDDFDIQMQSNGKWVMDDFHSNVGLEISCGSSIAMKGDVTAGRHVRIKDFNGHHVSYSDYPFSAPIVIEKHVWLCTGSSVNPGVTIASGVVVADNSNVINSVGPCSFVQGNPAVTVENNITFQI